jgi:hypothetical protein
VDQACFGLVGLEEERLLTAWTSDGGSGLLVQGSGLACQALVEHLLGEELANIQAQGFDLGQLGPPDRALGAVELLDQVFGYSLDVSPHFVYLRTPLCLLCHPKLLPGVASKCCSHCLKAL